MESTDLLRNLCTFAGEWQAPEASWPSARESEPEPLDVLGYWAHVLAHPLTLTLLASFGVSCLITGSLFLALVLASLPAICLLLVRVKTIRDVIDGQRRANLEGQVGKSKSTLKLRMHGAHRIELSRLESIAGTLRDRAPTETARRWLDDYLGLDRLVCSYANLALAYRTREERLSSAVSPSAPPARQGHKETKQPAQSLRRQVERVRQQNLDRLRWELSTIAHLLGAISSYIRLLHEASVRAVHLDHVQEDLASALDGWSSVQKSFRAEPPVFLVEALELAAD